MTTAFDIGFNGRGTAPFVTDQPFCVPLLGESYPHTYTTKNGISVNAGWEQPISIANAAAGNDPRIAGVNFQADNNGTPRNLRVDISSGSAPGAGTYAVDIAMGEADFKGLEEFFLKDGPTTILIDGTNGGAGIATLAGQFVDATLAVITASLNWNGTRVNKLFATTTANLTVTPLNFGAGTDLTQVAHFRLTFVPSIIGQGARPMYRVPVRVATTTALAAGGLQPVAGAPPPLAGAAFQDVFTSSAQTLAPGASQTVSWPAVPAGQRGIVEAIALTSSDPTTVTFQTTKNGVGVSPYPSAHLGSLGTLLNPFVLPTGIALLAGDVFAIVVTNTSGAPITFQVRSIGAFFS